MPDATPTAANFRSIVNAPAASPAPAAAPGPQVQHGAQPTQSPAVQAVQNVAPPPANGVPSLLSVVPGAPTLLSDDAPAATPGQAQQPQAPAPAAEPPAEGAPVEGAPAATDAADLLHGLSRDQVWEALRSGQLPRELLENMPYRTRIDGEDVEVPLSYALQSGMRQNTLTKAQQQLADDRRQFEGAKAQARQLFEAYNDPTGAHLLQSLEATGMASAVRGQVFSQWGTPDKPNTEGFFKSIQDAGHWGTFLAAAHEYAAHYGQLLNQYAPGSGDLPPEQRKAARERARAFVSTIEQQQVATFNQQAQLRAQQDEMRRQQAKAQRDQVLAAQQLPAQFTQQEAAQVATIKGQFFEHFGLPSNDVTEYYFSDFARRIMALNGGLSVTDVIARAAEATRDELAARNMSPGTTQQPPARPNTLPARPAAAPASAPAANVPQLPQEGGASAFHQRRLMLKESAAARTRR